MQLSEKMSRLGTETAFEVLARAEALKSEGKDIINLGIGQPDFKTPGHIVEAAVKALHDGHHGYTLLQVSHHYVKRLRQISRSIAMLKWIPEMY